MLRTLELKSSTICSNDFGPSNRSERVSRIEINSPPKAVAVPIYMIKR